jgi:hypothetical protein
MTVQPFLCRESRHRLHLPSTRVCLRWHLKLKVEILEASRIEGVSAWAEKVKSSQETSRFERE